MPNYLELFNAIRQRPGMFLSDEKYEEAAALVFGYDLACEGGVLAGFQEWLVMKLGKGANQHWSALVCNIAFPHETDPQEAARATKDTNRLAIETLFNLIAEFDNIRRASREGLKDIFVAFDRWLIDNERRIDD